jgi:hypothetical protein
MMNLNSGNSGNRNEAIHEMIKNSSRSARYSEKNYKIKLIYINSHDIELN